MFFQPFGKRILGEVILEKGAILSGLLWPDGGIEVWHAKIRLGCDGRVATYDIL